MLESRQKYKDFMLKLGDKPVEEQQAIMRYMAKTDLYFLCRFVLGWKFYDCDFAFDLCKQVEENPWRLWLVARGHLKSLTLTTAHNIQLVLNDPNITIAIISYNLKTAKSFLRQLKQELEDNELIKELFPKILYDKPEKQSPKWSEQEGLIVKRTVNRKEATIFAFGLVDSQATGMHFDIHSFDDAVTQDSVGTAEMIEKTTERWQLSDNLGMSGSVTTRKKYAGTRYHYHDTYKNMIDLQIPTIIIPATNEDGEPIFLSKEELDRKKAEQGSYIFSCQMMLNPVEKDSQKFTKEMVHYYDELPDKLDYYIAVDPANAQRKESDYTAGWILGFSPERKVYVVGGFHDKMSLLDRYKELKFCNDKYSPKRVGYEKYGMQTDIDFFRMENEKDSYFMPIFRMGGVMNKEDRILRLVALFENCDILFPKELKYFSKFKNKTIDLIDDLLFQMFEFPFCKHDDLLDCLSRVLDLFFNDPSLVPEKVITYEDTQTAGYRFQKMLNKRSEE